MILLTQLRGKPFLLNSDLIETVEATPDTVLTMVSGKKYLVQESLEEIQERVVEFRQKCSQRIGREESPI